jgi:hypothetical protein
MIVFFVRSSLVRTQRLEKPENSLDFLYTVLRYISEAAPHVTPEQLHTAITEAFPETGEMIMSTIAEKWKEEGLQQGLEQGRREMLLEGIELGLKLKFGHAALRILPELYAIEDIHILRAIHTGIESAQSLDELQDIYRRDGT